MTESVSPPWRRLLNSVAYSGLVALVAALGYLTFRTVTQHRSGADVENEAGESPPVSLIDLDNFVTRQEKSSDVERLNVSVRLRLTAPGSVACHVYMVARNDHVTPRLWAAWPPQEPGGAITAGGHFRGGSPPTGWPLTLSPSWTRVTASVDHPPGQAPFETVIVYVVGTDGEILLTRPFTL
jgi:hypothetical protein